MTQFLLTVQIIISILLIVFILLQQRGTAMGSAFGGGGSEGGGYSTRRGIQKKIYWASIVCGILFLTLAFLNLVL